MARKGTSPAAPDYAGAAETLDENQYSEENAVDAGTVENDEGVSKKVTLSLSELSALIEEAVSKKLAEAEDKSWSEDFSGGKNAAAPLSPEAAEADRRSKELVTIKLFYDGKKYKEPLTFAVNGQVYTYERGKYIEVPRFIKEILDNMERQDQNAAEIVQFYKDQLEKAER